MKTTEEMIEVMQAYVDGKSIDCLCYAEGTYYGGTPKPTWNWRHFDYRVRPRVFENNSFYPVIDMTGEKEVAWYDYGMFYLTGTQRSYLEDELAWIGEKLEIDWSK